jgi:hypothetical protein
MRAPFLALLKLFFKVHSYLQKDPLRELQNEFEGLTELLEHIEEMEKGVEATQAKAKTILESLRASLTKEDNDRLVQGVAILETERFNEKAKKDPRWDLRMIKDFVQKIVDRIELLQRFKIIDAENATLVKFKLFLKMPNDKIMKKNYYLIYILEVQSVLTVKDVLRLISEFILKANVFTGEAHKEDSSLALFVGKNPKSAAMEHLFEENGPELLEKFKRYTNSEDNLLANVCDFLPVLRVILQDQHRLTLHLKCEAESGVSIFRSVRSQAIIQQAIEEFFYGVLRVNPELEGNSKFDLRMNIYLFKKIVIYLLRKEVITVVDHDPKATDLPSADSLQSKSSKALDEREVFTKFAENDYSLPYKLMWIVQELRVTMENTFLQSEKELCLKIMESITQNINNKSHLISIMQDRNHSDSGMIKQELNFFDLFTHFQSTNVEGYVSEPDKFAHFCDKLGLLKLANNLSKKHFVIMARNAINPERNKLDLLSFTNLVEKVIIKTHQNRSVRKENIKETISEISANFKSLKNEEQPRRPRDLARASSIERSDLKLRIHNKSALCSPIVKLHDKGYEPLFSSFAAEKKRLLGPRNMSTIISKVGRYRMGELKPIPPHVIGRKITT